MSDDLDRILQEKKTKRRTPINPNVAAMPRVHGGRPLGEGPKLDVAFPWDADEGDAGSAQLQMRTPEVTLPQDRPVLSSGPHFAVPPRKEADVQTPVTIIPVVKAEAVVEPPLPPVPAVEKPQPPEKSPEKPPQKQREKQKEHLRAVALHKSYRKGSVEVPVLRGVDVRIHQGEFLAIEGQSGSGKSTLLHLLGTLDSPNKGEVHFHGRRIDNLPAANRDAIRNKRIGMIFQFYHLLPELSTLENVLTPIMIAEGVWSYWRNRRKYQETAKALLNLVGLSHRLKHKPRELSGGEMQRAAIARALIAQPELILADEPTGNLDQATGREILKILRTLNDRQKLTIVMVTHDQSLARQADRIVRLSGGVIEE
jgi:lipoprotein-releasing system ATP-binding protein